MLITSLIFESIKSLLKSIKTGETVKKKREKRKKDTGPVHLTLITLQCSAEVIATFLAVLRQVKINHVR